MTKFCVSCKTTKERDAFWKTGAVCRECHSKARKLRRAQWTQEERAQHLEKIRRDQPHWNERKRIRRRERTEAEREKALEKTRVQNHRFYEKDPSHVIAMGIAWRNRNYERFLIANRAGLKLRRAIAKGIVERPDTCEECGRQRPIEAAHINYARPFDVRWLCRPCHRTWDKREPKTKSSPKGKADA